VKRVIIRGNDHVFADGTTLKNLRDALAAASVTGMWHVCWEMAHRHGVEKILCMGCGVQLPMQQGTYVQRGGHAIRVCKTCHGKLRTPL
jgi:hypothetical protein